MAPYVEEPNDEASFAPAKPAPNLVAPEPGTLTLCGEPALDTEY
jgi:hypothetical protein